MTLAVETPRSRTAINLALLVLLATLWGAAYTLVKIGVETIPPLTLISARTLIAGGILLAIMRLRGITMPRDPAVWKRFMIQACLNSVIPFTLIAYAERHVGAGLATILGSNAPIFAFLLALLLVRHERPTLRQSFGVAAGLTGICLVVGVDALNGLGQDVIAQLALVLSAVLFGAAALFGRNFNGLDPMVPAAGSMICGAIILTPLGLIVDQPWTLTPSAASVTALIALAVFSTTKRPFWQQVSTNLSRVEAPPSGERSSTCLCHSSSAGISHETPAGVTLEVPAPVASAAPARCGSPSGGESAAWTTPGVCSAGGNANNVGSLDPAPLR